MSTTEFSELLLKNSEPLRPFAISLTRDNEIAKDLFQETLYKALANHEKYNSGTNIKAWLFTIMRNIFINGYRRNSRFKNIQEKEIAEHTSENGSSKTENSAESLIRQKEISMAIHQLPEIFRKSFMLYVNGYKYHEIAEALNEPLGTIKSRIFFARKSLREQISKN